MKSHTIPEGFEFLRAGRVTALVRSDMKDELVALGILDARRLDALRASGDGISSGRGAAVFINLSTGRGVLRHYRRAGPLKKLLRDRFWSRDRAMRELVVCEHARRSGVPMAECLAAIAVKRAIGYTADIIVREIENAEHLRTLLAAGPEPKRVRELLSATAGMFRRLCAAGVYHPDFHAENVLVRETGGRIEAFVIDLDKSIGHEVLPSKLRDRMLFRFNRALYKWGLAPRPIGFRLSVRLCIESGVKRSELSDFLRRCERHLERHRRFYDDTGVGTE